MQIVSASKLIGIEIFLIIGAKRKDKIDKR